MRAYLSTLLLLAGSLVAAFPTSAACHCTPAVVSVPAPTSFLTSTVASRSLIPRAEKPDLTRPVLPSDLRAYIANDAALQSQAKDAASFILDRLDVQLAKRADDTLPPAQPLSDLRNVDPTVQAHAKSIVSTIVGGLAQGFLGGPVLNRVCGGKAVVTAHRQLDAKAFDIFSVACDLFGVGGN